ncbi:TrpR-related protein YerC/YecD [Sporomusaceae bacterium BoRhaA]|uniref:YerC/YecD family TrpR-related protein n=1 Tax=Pelorhabdus rhamnosifermentans TaxID=2772457 RepID=UPI001C0628E3|nr:YerC/YecD family TrpR-related protein [Pelorhabdus rhamnosifermentans]MBU2702628.1 TrpR-related protein YerC/YecD [Pelorhabdus rhamnosifermentans]
MSINPKLQDPHTDQLFRAVLAIENLEECYQFFEDICTISELKAMAQRLEVARMLKNGTIYDDIVTETGASTATISRVKRCLYYGADGYKMILPRLETTKKEEKPE